MTMYETYDRIRSKKTEDKILQQYNETISNLMSEGYKTSTQIFLERRQLKINKGKVKRYEVKEEKESMIGPTILFGFTIFISLLALVATII